MPNSTVAPRQPRAARIAGPASAATTDPTLPPEMCALMAKPRRSGGNCSERSPLPTGCWGEPPIRETMVVAANAPKDWTADSVANPIPKSSCPAVRIGRRASRRVTKA